MKLTTEGYCSTDVLPSGCWDLAAVLRCHEGDRHDSTRAAPVSVAAATGWSWLEASHMWFPGVWCWLRTCW
jgi:hypothetical protein